ncbi:hypothetical protein ILUMI_08989, partial [Ignelater luminosus]
DRCNYLESENVVEKENQSGNYIDISYSQYNLQEEPLLDNNNIYDELSYYTACDTKVLNNEGNAENISLVNSSNIYQVDANLTFDEDLKKDYENASILLLRDKGYVINKADSDDERYDCLDDIHTYMQEQEEYGSLIDSCITIQQNAEAVGVNQLPNHNVVVAVATELTCDKSTMKGGILNLLIHEKSTHTKATKAKRRKITYHCYRCKYTTLRISDLWKHEKRHKRKKMKKKEKYKCTACNFASITKKKLSIHITTHLKQGYYKCEICNYLSANKDIVLLHQSKIHNLKKSYSCRKCNQSFVDRTSFKHHMKSAHLSPKCHKCELDISHKHEPFRCDLRRYVCSDKTALNRHIRARHSTLG